MLNGTLKNARFAREQKDQKMKKKNKKKHVFCDQDATEQKPRKKF